jgi:hypothetical protein
MANAVIVNEAANSANVGLFGPQTHVSNAHRRANAVEQSRTGRPRGRGVDGDDARRTVGHGESDRDRLGTHESSEKASETVGRGQADIRAFSVPRW